MGGMPPRGVCWGEDVSSTHPQYLDVSFVPFAFALQQLKIVSNGQRHGDEKVIGQMQTWMGTHTRKEPRALASSSDKCHAEPIEAACILAGRSPIGQAALGDRISGAGGGPICRRLGEA